MPDTPPNVTLQIDPKTINDLVGGQLRAAVALTFQQNSNRIIEQMVAGVLARKVDHNGKSGEYRSDIPLIDWLMGQAVQSAVEAEIREHVKANADVIRKKLTEHLRRKPDIIAGQLAAAMVSALDSNWSFTISAAITAAHSKEKAR